jgi:hypothetical protein
MNTILTDSVGDIKFEFVGQENVDVGLQVKVTLGPGDVPKEISLLGSGTLQIIGILLNYFDKPTDLNLILLDVPNIHRDIQNRLLRALIKFTNNTQVFITSHNESLIWADSGGARAKITNLVPALRGSCVPEPCVLSATAAKNCSE